jgi:hypothetical protein
VGFIGLIYFQKNILPSPLLQREEFPASNLFKRNKKNIKKAEQPVFCFLLSPKLQLLPKLSDLSEAKKRFT